MSSEPQYQRALKYLIEKRGIEIDGLSVNRVYRQGVYYLILPTQSNLESAIKKYEMSYRAGQKVNFGTLVAIELLPLPSAIIAERQDFSVPEKQASSSAPPRYTWREFFASDLSESLTDDEDALDETQQ